MYELCIAIVTCHYQEVDFNFKIFNYNMHLVHFKLDLKKKKKNHMCVTVSFQKVDVLRQSL